MRAKNWFNVAIVFAMGALAISAMAQGDHKPDLEERINKNLKLTDDEKAQVDPIIERHESDITAIRQDPVLTKSGKRDKIRKNLDAMGKEIEPYLTEDQRKRLTQELRDIEGVRGGFLGLGIHPIVTFTYDRFLPSNANARAIFGSSPFSYGFGFGLASNDIKRLRLGFGVDTFSVPGSVNTFFVLSPQAYAEYRIPIERHVRLFGRIAAGPAYIDYRYDTPGGEHFAAKRFGADGQAQVGVRAGPLELSATYRVLTQPSPVNFDGLQLSATLVVLRF